jgi:hypothetical protein
MKQFGVIVLMAGALVVLLAGQVLAFHCPALVKECQATADIVARLPGTDKTAVEEARKGCEAAMKLHQEGKHKESMIKAGEAIAAVSKALK